MIVPYQTGTLRRLLTTLGPEEPRDARAIGRRAALALGLPFAAAAHSAALALDERLTDLRAIEVRRPLFLVGPPRCGTTRLFRLLAADEARFTSFKAWQLLLPSLLEQRAARGLARLDAASGGPLRRRLDEHQRRRFQEFDRIHLTRLAEPEEDEFLFMYPFASELWALGLPVPEALLEYRHFDRLPEARRAALMRYYEGCVRRHLAFDGGGRQLLSKNTVFCNKLGSVAQTFPDAIFVLLVRHPCESVPSLLSLIEAMRAGMRVGRVIDQDRIVDFGLDCYRNGLDAIEAMPAHRRLLVRYEELVRSPRALVERIYRHFDLPLTPETAARLAHEEQAAARYESQHGYARERPGLSQAQLARRASDVIARLGYAA